jgi:hypothetical protein
MAQQRARTSQIPAATHSAKSSGLTSWKASGSASPIPSLHQPIGNQALSRLLQTKRIQAKLAVSGADDAYEREADRVADLLENPTIVKPSSVTSQTVVQRKCADCESEEHLLPVASRDDEQPARDTVDGMIQTKGKNDGGHDASNVESTLKSASQGGRPLDAGIRSTLEQRMGTDFSAVKIHTDATAAQMNRELNAQAFTHGVNIFFDEGKYDPNSTSGRRLISHELVHVVQQGGSVESKLIQRKKGNKKPGVAYLKFQVLVPKDYQTLDQMYRLFERTAYGREVGLDWSCNNFCDMSKNRGKVISFNIPKADIEENADPKQKKAQEESQKSFEQTQGKIKQDIKDEVNKRYYETSGDKPGTQIKKGEEGKAREWQQSLNEVMQEKQALENIPPEMKKLMGPETSYKPKDYQHLLKIAEKLKAFTKEDFAAYQLLTIRATDNLDLFEKSVDMFLARKEELKKALDEQQQKKGDADKQPTLRDALDEKWKGLDESAIGKMSESDQYALARRKADELTAAQLKYMNDHRGETLKDFAKSAALMNTGETFSAIGEDLQEVANGDANSWARWAAGSGAGAKLSGWMLAVAGVLYVASWLTGVGELATIAAGAAILLGSTITLSAVESELRVKAASQAKTPEEFKRNVELGAAAQTNVIVGVALIVVAAVLHFTAKSLFPETMKKINTSIKNFRERIRLKGSISDLKPQIKTEMGMRKAELIAATELAKQKAMASGEELGKLSTEQFVEKLEKGDGGFLDPSKLPPEQKVNYRELLKTPEGRIGIESYRTKLVNALKTDVVQAIDRLAQEYGSKIDELVKEVDAAKNHDDLKGALDKFESVLTEEHAKKFMAGEQEKITQQKSEEAAQEIQKKILVSIKDAIVKRLTARIARQADKFQLTYTDAELQAVVKRGKELGLSDQTIEDLVYTGSRTAKAISASDLVQQMENWVNEISKRGFPYKFTDMAEFQAFSKSLLDGLRSANLPTNDVRIQGSALRKTTADDVDIACFVDEATFDKLLVDRFNERAALKGGGKITLTGKSHSELVNLAQDIEANPAKYNSTAKTFANALKTSIINSKSDIIPALKGVRAFLAEKYPGLNIQTISVLIKGSLFDVKPDLPVTGK